MRIGDKVRLLRGTEEGRIVAIKGDKIIEVEIEEGFIIPALKNEVVLIDKKEADNFKIEDEEVEIEKPSQRSELILEGVYLAFSTKDHNLFDTFLFNQTKHTVLYSITQFDKKNIRGLASGICKPFDIQDLGELTSSVFNTSKRLNVQLLFHESESRAIKQPLNVELILDQDQFVEKVFLQSLDKEVVLINLHKNQSMKIDPSELKERMMGGKYTEASHKELKSLKKNQTIDLHMESMGVNLKSEEILDYQLNEFEKAYDNALLTNSEKLKIIHGIGAGILRNEIHKRLSMKKEVKFFEDADKERFGFGSTIIYF